MKRIVVVNWLYISFLRSVYHYYSLHLHILHASSHHFNKQANKTKNKTKKQKKQGCRHAATFTPSGSSFMGGVSSERIWLSAYGLSRAHRCHLIIANWAKYQHTKFHSKPPSRLGCRGRFLCRQTDTVYRIFPVDWKSAVEFTEY